MTMSSTLNIILIGMLNTVCVFVKFQISYTYSMSQNKVTVLWKRANLSDFLEHTVFINKINY